MRTITNSIFYLKLFVRSPYIQTIVLNMSSKHSKNVYKHIEISFYLPRCSTISYHYLPLKNNISLIGREFF